MGWMARHLPLNAQGLAVCCSMLTRAALLTIAPSAKESARVNRIPIALTLSLARMHRDM